jgi:hypothetical protein
MKTYAFTTVIAGVLSLVPAIASAATVTVVHGINGVDLGLSRALPVDIAVDGSCALSNITFGASTKVELPKGTYQVTVHPSTGDCSAAPVIAQAVKVPAKAKNIGLVAQVSNSGSARLKAFVNDGPSGSVIVNNAAKGEKFFAGSGLRGWIFYYANPLRNGDGLPIAGFGKNRHLTTVFIRANQRRPFYENTIKAGKTVVLYVVGSRKNGELVVSERIG